MITTKLWRLLEHPPVNNPVYQQAVMSKLSGFRISIWAAIELPVTLFFLALVPIMCVAGFRQITSIMVPIVITLALLMGSWWAFRRAVEIASAISTLKAQLTFELLAVTPSGSFGIAWAIVAGTLHYKKRYDKMGGVYSSMVFVTIGLSLFLASFGMVFASSLSDHLILVATRSLVLAVAILLIINHRLVALTITACLTGILAGAIRSQRANATAIAGVLFMIIQIGTIGSVIAMLSLVISVFDQIAAFSFPIRLIAENGLIVLTSIAFVRFFRLINDILWRIVCAQLDIAPDIDAALEQSL
jgi:hypothetical protein